MVMGRPLVRAETSTANSALYHILELFINVDDGADSKGVLCIRGCRLGLVLREKGWGERFVLLRAALFRLHVTK